MLGQIVRPLRGGLILVSLRHVLYWGVAGLLLAVMAALAVAVVPPVLGHRTYVINGGSMGGDLPNGSVAISDWVPASAVQTGDTIVVGMDVEGERLPKAHRVTRVDTLDDQRVVLQTKGDANSAPDPDVIVLAESDQVMKVHRHVPLAGYVVHFVRTPLGWALAVMLPAALICAATIRQI
jgi:signal peptidase I